MAREQECSDRAGSALRIVQCRPIAVTVIAAVVLSSVAADPGRTTPTIIATEAISVQLQAAADDLALNTTALVNTVTGTPTAAATVASAVGPSEILAVLSNLVTAAVTVVGTAAWFAAFPITMPISYIVAQGLSDQYFLGPYLSSLGPLSGLAVFVGLPFLQLSIVAGEILRPIQPAQAVVIAAPRPGAGRTPIAPAATRPAARTRPAAAVAPPARSASVSSAHKRAAATQAPAKARHRPTVERPSR